MSRFTATDRLARLLAIVPWVASHPDGAVLDDVASRFGYPADQLVRDLQEVLVFVGVHPYTPDMLIEVAVDGDRVWIQYADWFTKPLRLDPEQALGLLAAGRSVLAMTAEEDGPLLRGLTKLGTALGATSTADDPVDIELGTGSEETLALLRTAVSEQRAVSLDYYSYGSDRRSRRVVEPRRFYADRGNWYLDGYCRSAEAQRVFRVDRIRAAELLDEHVEVPATAPSSPTGFATSDAHPRAVLGVPASAAWISDQYPVDEVTTLPDGSLRISLAVTAEPWLERLLLRLGPEAVIEPTPGGPSPDLGRRAAARVLDRYRRGVRPDGA